MSAGDEDDVGARELGPSCRSLERKAIDVEKEGTDMALVFFLNLNSR